MTKIIGFTGRMGSGKSTLIKCLKDVQNKDLELFKFAQPLYDMQEAVYEIIKKGYVRPKDFLKDRKLLQFLGTEWGRDTLKETLWSDIWKKSVLEFIDLHPTAGKKEFLIVTDDIRFDTEAELVKSMGGIVIEVTSNKTSERIDTSNSSHKSESGIDRKYVDAIIENNGTIQDLRDSLLTLNTIVDLW